MECKGLTVSSLLPDVNPPMDHFSALPVELIEEIFDLACAGNRPPRGIISKRFLPFQRRCYRSLSAPSYRERSDETQCTAILSGAARLEHLDLSTFRRPARLLALLPAPRRLLSVKLRAQEFDEDDDDTPSVDTGKQDDHVLPPLSLLLTDFTSLTSLSLEGMCNFFSRSFRSTFRSLPLEHLTFEGEGDVLPRQLEKLISGEKRLRHLRRLTLNMFGWDAQ
ncbi:hypothetical protein JCM8547_004682 [Rhodosporidiobolus lusitaniae]